MNSSPKLSLFHDYLVLRFSVDRDFLHLSSVNSKVEKDDIK